MIRYCKRTTFGKVSLNQLLIGMKLVGSYEIEPECRGAMYAMLNDQQLSARFLRRTFK